MKKIKLDVDLGNYMFPATSGTASFILTELVDLESMYHRKGLCLKLFLDNFKPLEDFTWSSPNKNNGRNFLDCCMIQNIYAMYGLSARIYDIIIVEDINRIYYAQVTDYITGEIGKFNPENEVKCRNVNKEYNIHAKWDMNDKNWIDQKLIDFSYHSFKIDEYRDKVTELVNTYADYGSRPESYQAVEELDIKSQRTMEHRLKIYEFDTYVFNNKTVIDLGSSSGAFCREVTRRGAKRVVGVDISIELQWTQYNVCNILGPQYWNIDFHTIDLRTKQEPRNADVIYKELVEATGFESFDVVLFLSMVQHVGFPHYIGKFCNEWFLLEGNIAHHHHMFIDDMKKYFKTVEADKATTDHMTRVALKGWK